MCRFVTGIAPSRHLQPETVHRAECAGGTSDMSNVMQLLGDRTDTAARFADYMKVGRELRLIRTQVAALSVDECRHVYGLITRQLARYDAGATREDAFLRSKSVNVPLRLTGLAQWLVATYLDTRGIPHETIRFRHDDVQQLIRKIGLRANPPKTQTQTQHQTLRG